jgi:MFS family permease
LFLGKDSKTNGLPRFHLGNYLRNGLDLKIWGFASIFGLTTVTIVSSVTFLPIILNTGMGFGIAASQCLTAPPWIFSCIVMIIQGWLGDKYHLRSPILAFNCCAMFIGKPTNLPASHPVVEEHTRLSLSCHVLGLALLGYAHSPGVRYFGSFIAAAMGQANIPCVLAWQANNVRGQWKRAFSSATVVGAGGVGGVIGSLVFRLQDAPLYRPGIWACMTANGLILLVVPLLTLKFYRANQRAQHGGKVINGVEGFLYTY